MRTTKLAPSIVQQSHILVLSQLASGKGETIQSLANKIKARLKDSQKILFLGPGLSLSAFLELEAREKRVRIRKANGHTHFAVALSRKKRQQLASLADRLFPRSRRIASTTKPGL